jgi:4-carboxymuconolactone decarboxylase
MVGDPSFDAGVELRKAMWGAGSLEQITSATQLSEKLQEIVTRFCFGDLWQREGLTKRERSLITVAMLLALNRPHELRVHMEGALANGATEVEIREVALHSVPYAGIPAGASGIQILGELLTTREPDSPLLATANA